MTESSGGSRTFSIRTNHLSAQYSVGIANIFCENKYDPNKKKKTKKIDTLSAKKHFSSINITAHLFAEKQMTSPALLFT